KLSHILMKAIFKFIEERNGITELFLEVRPSNKSALKLYQSFGFIKVSIRKKYYSDGEDALILKREFARI
ncbi:MAG: GNAT family N-acetyltransferase, partial [Oligoflexales bacterium]|nr:GNAT family N-acetyltransferase [Oligoflexales bacterium]